jgi:hypothetical protein
MRNFAKHFSVQTARNSPRQNPTKNCISKRLKVGYSKHRAKWQTPHLHFRSRHNSSASFRLLDDDSNSSFIASIKSSHSSGRSVTLISGCSFFFPAFVQSKGERQPSPRAIGPLKPCPGKRTQKHPRYSV